MQHKLKSGQINYENKDHAGSYSCIVIKDGKFHNMSEDQRLDLIKHLEGLAPEKTFDFESMF